MKIGDIVNFKSNSWVMARDYPNPGIIHEVSTQRNKWNPSDPKPHIRATVLWSNGTMTNESICYLEVINEASD